MNKLVLSLTTVATLGLSSLAFAQNPTALTQERVQPPQLQVPVAHNLRAHNRTDGKKVVVAHHRSLHRGTLHQRHYSHYKGKRIVNHMVDHKTLRTRAPRNIANCGPE
jgi:hypothetical protein